MKYLKYGTLISLIVFLSCEEAAEEFDCETLSAELITGLAAYAENPADTASCLSLKSQAADFMNNSCDTSTTGDLSFFADSLDCGMMACALPIGNLIAYGIAMQFLVDPDSATYCAYFDSTVMAMEAIVATGGCVQDGFAGVTQAMVDSVKAAGCDWTLPLETLIIGQWQTVKYCIHEDGENCSGEKTCQDIDEPGLTDGFTFNVYEDGTLEATGAQCECQDEDGESIEGCDWEELDNEQPGTQSACEALGGYWNVWVEELNTMIWSDSDPNQFEVTIDESYCNCVDENGNEIQDCEWSEADEAQDQSACEAIGGVWYPEFFTLDFTVSAAADTISFNFTDYDEAACDCEDEDGVYIEGCDWEELDNESPGTQSACEALGGYWGDEEWICIGVYNTKF